ncbi:MAG TPA: hypothetical protein VGR64_05695 [Terracidiphilus sp.]|nr:hypothetical protein [Terracidiphilus sp.]
MAQRHSGTIKLGVVGLGLVCLASGFIPIRFLAAPQWDVWVKNEAMDPLAGVNVRLTYRQYSAESQSHEITLVTNQSGHVTFLPQYRAASLFQKAFYTARSALAGAHASFGNHAFVFVFGDGYEGDAETGHYITDWTGSPTIMTSTIIAMRSLPIFTVAAAKDNAVRLGSRQIQVRGHFWWGKEGSMIYDSGYKAILPLHYSAGFNSKYPIEKLLRAVRIRKSDLATITGRLQLEPNGRFVLAADDIQFVENPH